MKVERGRQGMEWPQLIDRDVEDIIAFLEAGEINMAGLHTATLNFPAQEAELELSKNQVGVTVIVPRTLVSSRFAVTKRI